jgi:hypothetical protein
VCALFAYENRKASRNCAFTCAPPAKKTRQSLLEQNQNSRAQVKSLQCGFFLGKKPLRGRAVGYSYSGSAVKDGRMLNAPVTVDPPRPQKTQTSPSGGDERS